MNKPYIICYMMTSIDGRIDCKMTESLRGVEEYYKTLDELDIKSAISGRITAELEMALPGKFIPKNNNYQSSNFFVKHQASTGYDIICDTYGTLLWDDDFNYSKPHIIITSQMVTTDYLAYLDSKNISYIVAGKDKIDLELAASILYDSFNIKRLGVLGGAKINTGFLKANLLDEIDLLIGAGIDARASYPTMFDGLADDNKVFPLKLNAVKRFESDAVLLSYKVIK